jgi:hypothetical protein
MRMISVAVSVLLIGIFALGPIVWRVWRDRREEQALVVRAEVEVSVRRALGGESLVSVQVEPPRPLRSGRVILSVPGGWDWLIRDAWTRVMRHVPHDYELVVHAGERTAAPADSPERVLRRAA